MTPIRRQKQSPNNDISASTDLSTLRQQVGFFKKWEVNRAVRDAAGEGLKLVQLAQVNAETNIALTAVSLAEAAIRTSLVANAMPQIGALTTRVNAATTAVDQALTNGSAAETYTHLSNRASNIALANELHTAGKITLEESDVVISFAQADAAEDISRSRARMTEAKTAVSGLHEFALKGIANAKGGLSG